MEGKALDAGTCMTTPVGHAALASGMQLSGAQINKQNQRRGDPGARVLQPAGKPCLADFAALRAPAQAPLALAVRPDAGAAGGLVSAAALRPLEGGALGRLVAAAVAARARGGALVTVAAA